MTPQEILDKAFSAPRGVRVTFANRADAKRFRARCYAIKRREFRRALRSFPIGDHRRGVTAYDCLTFTVEPAMNGAVILTILKDNDVKPLAVEVL